MYILHSFIQAISIMPIQVHYHSEALLTQHGYCVRVSRRSATSNCRWRTCSKYLCGGRAGFEPTTLLTKGIESTNEPTRPITLFSFCLLTWFTTYAGAVLCWWLYCRCGWLCTLDSRLL